MNIVVRTNLQIEERRQRRRLTPAQILAGASCLLAIVGVGFWWLTSVELATLRAEYATKKEADAGLDRDLTVAREKQARRDADVARRDAVLKYAANRVNVAPVLETLFAATPANVEISKLRVVSQSHDSYIMEITGRSAGAQPRLECDKCRLLLANALTEAGFQVTANFSRLEDATGTIHFEDSEYPVADFVIEVKLKPGAHNDGKT